MSTELVMTTLRKKGPMTAQELTQETGLRAEKLLAIISRMRKDGKMTATFSRGNVTYGLRSGGRYPMDRQVALEAMPPGEPLRMKDLRTLWDVAATTAREVVTELQEQGLVSREHSGTSVLVTRLTGTFRPAPAPAPAQQPWNRVEAGTIIRNFMLGHPAGHRWPFDELLARTGLTLLEFADGIGYMVDEGLVSRMRTGVQCVFTLVTSGVEQSPAPEPEATGRSTFRDELERAVGPVLDMLEEKNAAYGSSFAQTCPVSKLSPQQALGVRIGDKIRRITDGHQYRDEDTMMDLLGYLILAEVLKGRGVTE